jgi:hypothetical protein
LCRVSSRCAIVSVTRRILRHATGGFVQVIRCLEVCVPSIGRIGLVCIDRAIAIHQVKKGIARTGYGGNLYPCNQVAGRAIVFLDFPLELYSPPGVRVKPDVVSVGIRYVTTVGYRLKRSISDAD